MAQVLKRCECPRSKWGKCPHSWTVRYWDGRQRERSFKRNHGEALKFSKRIEAEKLSIHHGDPLPPIALADYSQMWLAGLTTSANTKRIYEAAFRLHINPVFGTRKLDEVAGDREGVTSFLKGLSNGTADSAYAALSACLSEARRAGRLSSTRLSGIRYLAHMDGPGPLQFHYATHAELVALTEGMPGPLRPAIWLMRGCGLRRGEVLAVHRNGFADGRLRITEQQLAVNNTRAPLKSRKPGEFRDVPVPAYVADAVAGLDSEGYLFSIPTRTFDVAFRSAADKAGLEGFRMHDLRHCFASAALSRGVAITDVAKFLGHRNIQVTFGIYGHLVPSSFGLAAQALQDEYDTWAA